MQKSDLPPDIESAKKRLEELREKRIHSNVSELIQLSPSTILINLLIEIAAAILLVVGLLYIFKFVSMRQAYYISGTSRVIFYGIITVSTVWLIFVFNKIHRRIKLLNAVIRERKKNSENLP